MKLVDDICQGKHARVDEGLNIVKSRDLIGCSVGKILDPR